MTYTAAEIILRSPQPSPFTALRNKSDVRKVAFVLFSPSAFGCTALQLLRLAAFEWECRDPLFSSPPTILLPGTNLEDYFF